MAVHSGTVVDFGNGRMARAVMPVGGGSGEHSGALIDLGNGQYAYPYVQVDDSGNVITQSQTAIAVGVTSNPQRSAATYGDLTDMSVTLTTTGGNLICWFAMQASNSGAAGSIIDVAFSLDGAAEVGGVALSSPAANYYVNMSTVWMFTGVAADEHTVNVRWLTTAATTATAFSTRRQLIVREVPA